MLDFEQRAGSGPSSTEISGSFATHLDRVRILCDGGISQQGHGCHPMLELKEAAEKFPMMEVFSRRQFAGQE